MKALPEGWTERESKSNPGKLYYVSPEGKTQWVRPIQVLDKAYEFNRTVEIEFTAKRLGVGLREIDQTNENILYPEFPAEVEDLPKVDTLNILNCV